jgi:hypothetical protein
MLFQPQAEVTSDKSQAGTTTSAAKTLRSRSAQRIADYAGSRRVPRVGFQRHAETGFLSITGWVPF